MVVYTRIETLEQDLQIPAGTLYGVSSRVDAHYRKKSIAKSDGTVRHLSVPDAVLKKIQRQINRVLLCRMPVSAHAAAYRAGASAVKNARCHQNKPCLLTLDIYHFFDHVRYTTVKERVFPADRFAEPLRVLLSILCYHGDKLPQGAPTSPAIANIVLREFDEKVAAFCAAWQITYTRYCDDLAFSGDFEPEPVVDFVKQALAEEGFRLNWKKVRFSTAGCRQQVTGLVVNRGVRTPAEYRAKLRQQLYYLEKYGTASCLERMAPAETEEAYLARLLGQVSYALCVDPADAELQKEGALLRKLLAEARLQA